MANKHTTNSAFNYELIEKVWQKAVIIPGFDPEFLREDEFGTVIARVFYEECQPGFALGWRIVHIKPLSEGGTNDIDNLMPLQWENKPGKPSTRSRDKQKASAKSKKPAKKAVSK